MSQRMFQFEKIFSSLKKKGKTLVVAENFSICGKKLIEKIFQFEKKNCKNCIKNCIYKVRQESFRTALRKIEQVLRSTNRRR